MEHNEPKKPFQSRNSSDKHEQRSDSFFENKGDDHKPKPKSRPRRFDDRPPQRPPMEETPKPHNLDSNAPPRLSSEKSRPRIQPAPPSDFQKPDRRYDKRVPSSQPTPPNDRFNAPRPFFQDRGRRMDAPVKFEIKALHPNLQVLVATSLHGMEEVLAEELFNLGAKNIKILKRAVQFEGDQRTLYRANLELRTAVRVLIPIAAYGNVRSEDQLYEVVRAVDWSAYINVKQTLAVDAVTAGEFFRHSKFASLKTKDAIVDQFRDKFGVRPNIQLNTPSLRVHVFINEDVVEISLDAAGDSLHKRGYRTEVLEAPINEVLAAGMLLMAGWDGSKNLIDPMCGSGTLLMEAALIARNIPPQFKRTFFGFHQWKDFDSTLWADVVEASKAAERPFEHKILGSDKHFQAIGVAERNLLSSELTETIQIERKEFEKLTPPDGAGMLIMNPPYDERLESDDIKSLYKMIGERFKKAFMGYDAWLISSNMEAVHSIGLHASRKVQLFNGSLECRFLKYEMYEGSKKSIQE